MILIDEMLRKRKIRLGGRKFLRIPKTSERCGSCAMFCNAFVVDYLCFNLNRDSRASYIPDDFYVHNLKNVWVC